MIDKPYFVMLNCQNGMILPLVGDNEEVCMFSSENDAMIAANDTVLGSAFGFEVFELGGGVDYR